MVNVQDSAVKHPDVDHVRSRGVGGNTGQELGFVQPDNPRLGWDVNGYSLCECKV